MSALTISFAVLAGLLHILFFALESLLFRQRRVWRRFGVTSQADADVVFPMAYNQGFYNLFLALGVLAGLIIGGVQGKAVLVFACACMLGAAVVLITNNLRFAKSAAVQGIPPLIAILGLLW